MKPTELEKVATFMLEKGQTGKLNKMIEEVLIGCGYGGFIEVMKENKYKLNIIKKVSEKIILSVSNHARKRTTMYLHKEKDLTDEEMKKILLNGTVISYGDLLSLGFRPNYQERLKDGEDSIYSKIGNGLIAVLHQDNPTKLVWITTYTEERTPYKWRTPLTEKEFMKFAKTRSK